MLETNLNYWSIQSRDSFDYQYGVEIHLWNRKRNEEAIELEGTVNYINGDVIEVYETQGFPEDQVKDLLVKAWLNS